MNLLEEKNASCEEKRSFNTFYDKPLFNLFGIDLFIDDILILCIIYSMYKDGIKDQMLFMFLLFLLFS